MKNFSVFAGLITNVELCFKKSHSRTYPLQFLMCCPARHTDITHYCPRQSLHHTRPLASPCPIMLHWTSQCCFCKLSGHICRSLFGVSVTVFALIDGTQSKKNLLIFLQTALM